MTTELSFTCEIPDPGTSTSLDRVGPFPAGQQQPRIRPATCRLQGNSLLLSCRHVYGGEEIVLMELPRNAIRKVSCSDVTTREGPDSPIKQEVLGSMAVGATMGLIGMIIVGVKIANDPSMGGFEMGPFLGISVLLIGGFAAAGAFFGLLKGSFKETKCDVQTFAEFTLSDERSCLLAFRVRPEHTEEIRLCLEKLGLEV